MIGPFTVSTLDPSKKPVYILELKVEPPLPFTLAQGKTYTEPKAVEATHVEAIFKLHQILSHANTPGVMITEVFYPDEPRSKYALIKAAVKKHSSELWFPSCSRL